MCCVSISNQALGEVFCPDFAGYHGSFRGSQSGDEYNGAHMSIVAVAFHEQLAGRKLREFYASTQAGARTKIALTEYTATSMS
jgi:hypothetical protein